MRARVLALARLTLLELRRGGVLARHLLVLILVVALPSWLKAASLHQDVFYYLLGNGGLGMASVASAGTGVFLVARESRERTMLVLLSHPLEPWEYLAGRTLGVLGHYGLLLVPLAAWATLTVAAGLASPSLDTVLMLGANALSAATFIAGAMALALVLRPFWVLFAITAGAGLHGLLPAVLATQIPSPFWRGVGRAAELLSCYTSRATTALQHPGEPVGALTWVMHLLGIVDRAGTAGCVLAACAWFYARRDVRLRAP